MSFEGMDVDQLQGLAKQVSTDAQVLSDLVTTLTGVVGRLPLFWQGPVAVSFEQDWQAKHRPALLAASSTLTALHAHLVSNISQQAAASAADPAGAAGTAGPHGISGGSVARDLWSGTQDVAAAAGAVLFPVPFLQQGAGKAEQGIKDTAEAARAAAGEDRSLLGKLKDGANRVRDAAAGAYEDVTEAGDGQAADLVDSSGMTWLRDSANMRKAGDFLNSGPASKVVDRATLAGVAVGAAQTLSGAVGTIQDLRHGEDAKAGDEAVETVSDGLKSIPTPVTYLAGVDVNLVSADVKMAYNTDWSDVPNPLNADNFRKYYLPQFTSGSLWRQSAGVIWGAL
jgi:uncharacterized protein YukE